MTLNKVDWSLIEYPEASDMCHEWNVIVQFRRPRKWAALNDTSGGLGYGHHGTRQGDRAWIGHEMIYRMFGLTLWGRKEPDLPHVGLDDSIDFSKDRRELMVNYIPTVVIEGRLDEQMSRPWFRQMQRLGSICRARRPRKMTSIKVTALMMKRIGYALQTS
jgi:hypothetical protein